MTHRATASGGAPLPTASSKRSPVGRSAVKRSTSPSPRPYFEGQVANRSANRASRARASARYSTRLLFGGRVLALAVFGAGPARPGSWDFACHESRRVTVRFDHGASGLESTMSNTK